MKAFKMDNVCKIIITWKTMQTLTFLFDTIALFIIIIYIFKLYFETHMYMHMYTHIHKFNLEWKTLIMIYWVSESNIGENKQQNTDIILDE